MLDSYPDGHMSREDITNWLAKLPRRNRWWVGSRLARGSVALDYAGPASRHVQLALSAHSRQQYTSPPFE